MLKNREKIMAITALNVTMTVNPKEVTCPPVGGKFTVIASVRGRADRNGGSYDVFIYDRDRLSADDQLASSTANGVTQGNFAKAYTFTLNCNASCEVAGPDGSSGEGEAEIYAFVDGGGGTTAESGKQTIKCVPPKDDEEREPGQRETERSPREKR
jgi:hypothetical protein